MRLFKLLLALAAAVPAVALAGRDGIVVVPTLGIWGLAGLAVALVVLAVGHFSRKD